MYQKIVPLSKAKAKLLEIARHVDDEGQSFIFTRDGEPVGAFIPMNEYESYMETFEIMENKELMAQIRRAQDQAKKGNLWRKNKSGKWMKAK